MILEIAIFNIRPGETEDFEAGFEQAKAIIAASDGFLGAELRRSVEDPDRYVLLARWATLEAHTEGFRGSEGFAEWRRLLSFYRDPAPIVEHFHSVVEVPAPV